MKTSLLPYIEGFSPSTKKRLLTEITRIIDANNVVAQILSSSDYKAIISAIRKSTPDIFSGEISCVDGRLPSLITHLPKITRTWKEPGAVAVSSNFTSKLPARLAIAIESHFAKYSNKQLIEFVQAHTSLKHQKDHGCGATKLALGGTGPNFNQDGGLSWNIRQLNKTTAAALINHAGKYKKLLTVIFEVLDTDTGSILYGLDQFSLSPLSGKRIQKLIEDQKVISAKAIHDRFIDTLHALNGSSHKVFLKDLLDPKKALSTYKQIHHFSQKINNNSSIKNYVFKQIGMVFKGKPVQVQEFILYRLLHNISFGYLTGSFEKPHTNPFTHHHEQYISIGEVGIGDEVVSTQGFRINHTGLKQIVDDLIIMLDLMQKNAEVSLPFIVFEVRPVNKKLYQEDPYQQTLQRARTTALGIKRAIYSHSILSRRLINKEFILIPCLVEEKNQEVLEILSFN